MKSRIMGSFRWDIVELAGNLRQEHLFISSEQQNLQNLNTKVDCVSSSLAQLAWVTAQQRDNLNQLIVARPDCTPASCCHKANTLESTTFVDGYKVLGFQECMSYGQFLQNLRNSPQLLASCLVIGDKVLPADVMTSVAHCIGSGLLGSSLLPNDKMLALQLLRHLTELQLVPSENPRRLLRQKSCAFARLYGEFHEGLFSAKLFLTAALHNPIMQLLMEDEMFLDIDPDKATIRFPQEERLKKFGAEGTPEYYKRLAEYRKWTNSRLVSVTNRFVSSLRENMHCFPFGICWLVRQIADLLSKSPNSDPKEVHAICTDLVFTYFICPAIVNPEPYGITDAPISYIARFNLIQVAQIVQTLAMIKYEDVGSKVADLYSHFSKDCVASILDMILDEEASSINVELTVEQNSKLCGLTRSAALFTETELHTLVSFLQSVLSESQLDTSIIDKEQLVALIRQLPASCNNNNIGNSPKVQPKVTSPPDTPNKRTGFLGKVSRNRNISTSPASSSGVEESGTDDDLGERGPDVLVIPFRLDLEGNIGLIPEQKVLCMDDTVESHVRVSLPDDSSSGSNIVERAESQEKRTRFSLLHDEGSIGNTSDNLEAVSEAASNHSVASSLELENEDQNDNLSDMVSANVSGRGTPNISGRDTPSSQITEGEDGQVGMLRGSAGESRQTLDFPPTSANKQSRSDIDDKFGKFEIKKLIEGDETVSMVSDTWSTDVLASDSETIEQSERSFSVNAAESAIQQLAETTQMLDISETASEAWSTDVLASDSERLTEVDTDDTGSVARSDDTARSEVEAEGRTDTEGGEETPPSSAYGLNATFRPIKGDENGRQMLLIPISPTRIDAPANPVWNVTGRGGGKADYRRRTVEYVDNNANNIILRRESAVDFIKHAIQNVEETPLIHVIDKIDKSSDVKASVPAGGQTIINIPSPVVMVPPIANQAGSGILAQNGPMTLPHFTNGCVTFSTNHPVMVPSISNTPQIVGVPNVDLELKQELVEDDLDQESVGEAMLNVVRLSSASLASSSSSGSSSEPRPKTATPTPDIPLPSPLVVNGHAMMLEGSQIVTKTNQASSSTGAIPKSISFDKTAERGDKDLLDEDSKHKRSFFRNFKLPFKSRRFKTQRSGEELGHRSFDGSLSGVEGDMTQPRLRCRGSEEIHPSSSDTTEDILAKYRRKPGTTSSLSSDQNVESTNPVKHKQPIDERLKIDPSNIEASYAFIDAKRKLRMVLSTADLQYGPWMPNSSFGKKAAALNKDNELVSFLQLQLAEAINLHNRSLIAHLHETLRCIRRFDDDGCCKLFLSLQDDYSKRSPYIAYLVRCKQGLLSTLTHLERMMDRVKCDKDVCNQFLISVCVRMFLERREQMLVAFQSEFQQLTLADEKTDLLDKFLHTLSLEMDRDPTWQAASGAQIEQAHTAIERAVISRVYLQAIYPNGDGDISRDQVLHEHMKKLADVITPDHKDLRIPKMFHYECPWPSAQAEIVAISAYKTPRDKLLCVFRCATTIMNLLSMACESGVPAADDFVPVLVYVLIKANPPSLLSTVQYVNSFYGSRLEGEDQYWWIQFCSAIEFIKTMDYSD